MKGCSSALGPLPSVATEAAVERLEIRWRASPPPLGARFLLIPLLIPLLLPPFLASSHAPPLLFGSFGTCASG